MPRKTKAPERVFPYDGRGRKPDFEVRTRLTDQEAILELTNGQGIQPGMASDTFESKCAFEIHKQAHGFGGRSNMIAWGFKLAEEKRNPVAPSKLSEEIRSMVRFRRPLTGEAEGNPFRVSLCGDRSTHAGEYAITDGGPYGRNRFYGYAKPDGTWKPTRSTPKAVIDRLTE